MLDRILTKVGQNDQWVIGYKSYQQFDLKGHVGVTGVKKVIFTKNVSSHLYYVAGSHNSCILISIVFSIKVINHRSIRGHLGHRGQKCEFLLIFSKIYICSMQESTSM